MGANSGRIVGVVCLACAACLLAGSAGRWTLRGETGGGTADDRRKNLVVMGGRGGGRRGTGGGGLAPSWWMSRHIGKRRGAALPPGSTCHQRGHCCGGDGIYTTRSSEPTLFREDSHAAPAWHSDVASEGKLEHVVITRTAVPMAGGMTRQGGEATAWVGRAPPSLDASGSCPPPPLRPLTPRSCSVPTRRCGWGRGRGGREGGGLKILMLPVSPKGGRKNPPAPKTPHPRWWSLSAAAGAGGRHCRGAARTSTTPVWGLPPHTLCHPFARGWPPGIAWAYPVPRPALALP